MAEFTPQMVQTPRLAMNVWTSGPEDGRPVLLIHGNITTGGYWRYVADLLPDDVRVICGWRRSSTCARWPVGRSVTIRWRHGVSGQTFLAAATYHRRLVVLLLNMRSRGRDTENFDGWPVVVREPSPTPGPGGTGLFGALKASRRRRRGGRWRPGAVPRWSNEPARTASRR